MESKRESVQEGSNSQSESVHISHFEVRASTCPGAAPRCGTRWKRGGAVQPKIAGVFISGMKSIGGASLLLMFVVRLLAAVGCFSFALVLVTVLVGFGW